MQDLISVEAALEAACQQAIAQGFTIQPTVFWTEWTSPKGKHHAYCCPIGAVSQLANPKADRESYLLDAASLLHATQNQMWSFITGFDNLIPSATNEITWYDLGTKFRRRYLTQLEDDDDVSFLAP